MENRLERNIDNWKKSLLELGKRNKLINYKDTKRSNINIVEPGINDLFENLVLKEKAMAFPLYEDEVSEDGGEPLLIHSGDIRSDRTLVEEQKTLRNLRSKSKSFIQEQGINVLYMSFGFLEWKEAQHSDVVIKSPLVLVPVTLTMESIADPYVLKLHEDEIVLNPTLAYKLEEDFGIILPEYDNDNEDIVGFLKSLQATIGNSQWNIVLDASISLLSFMKMNMYKDIENNIDRIKSHPVLKALAGDSSDIERISEDYDGFDHDTMVRPLDTFQVVDADSSQQDAILYSKNNISFILQGPPGTGKSQTITNIISEGLADGKKILFVSEKAAALEVVHSRLSSIGLSEFCLSLHNNKKNKKEVLNDLHQTFNLDKHILKEEILYDLHNLENERSQLNQYVRDLHEKNEPLNKSIFEISGNLVELPECEDLLFSIADVKKMTQSDLNKIKKSLDDFSHVLGMMKKDYKENPWVGCNIPNVTHEFRLNAKIELENLRDLVKKYNEALSIFDKVMNVEWTLTIDEIDDYVAFLKFIKSSSNVIPKQWLYGDSKKITTAIERAKDYKHTLADYDEITDNLMMKYEEGYFQLDAQHYFNELSNLREQLDEIRNLEVENFDDLISHIDKSIDETDNLQKSLTEINEVVISIAKKFKLGTIRSYEDFEYVSNVLSELEKKPSPTDMWFDGDKAKVVDELLVESIRRINETQGIKDGLGQCFENAIYTIEHKEMLVRFRTQYTNFLKVFKKQYRGDKALLKGIYKGSEVLSDQIIVDKLQLLSTLSEHQTWFEDKETMLSEAFGKRYMKEYTDWEAIKTSRLDFEKLKSMVGKSITNEDIKVVLCEGVFPDELEEADKHIKKYLASSQWMMIKNQIDIKVIQESGISQVPSAIRKIYNILVETKKCIEPIEKTCQFDLKFSILMNDLEKKSKLEQVEENLEKNYQSLKEVFNELFDGMDTNWEQIISSLEWTEKFIGYKTRYEVSNEFIETFQTNSSCHDLLEVLQSNKNIIQSKWTWFKGLFDINRGLFNSNTFELVNIVNNCVDGFTLLEEWVDYRNHLKVCEEMGLGEYIKKAEEVGILRTHLSDGYFRRFYKLWLDFNIVKYPSVLNFRQRVQDERIKNFRDLDKRSLDIARARVRSKLIDQLPNRNFTSSAGDEVSILNREMSKRRRIMPLRKLFASIPNLLMTLKPCMMMSPLSVSMFLQAASYDFDMIIFDEASQVKTEDAVGAIMRGKTVIICGDDKQLPPTSFFGTSKMNDDYDSEDEELDSYESILDEALTVLPNRTLKWHYRSRHEHLIAFSNAKIYNHELVTFPSCKDDVPDEGVEYIHVIDGVYDKGGSRNNIIEAKKVAQLVIDHFIRKPDRSLGVVTFSTAQQVAIEDELRRIRKDDNSYEGNFSEEKQEPFFVKNLETVQGDERDTIIFSIGYAKDGTGKPMAMNFGPLTKDGGERRLNVAITRAKHNVKLVGSIHPTDIDLERATSEGVRLLRSYIEFAKHGPDALLKETSVSSVKEFDSPFEKGVYDFLVRKGYKVDTQVGCSGYRIDLGVKHPEISGIYVMGIECDGATYHSTRTARERDRIRQTVLEDMGWSIHRIWSTDYIKDPKNENRKLLESIEKCIENFTLDQDVISEAVALKRAVNHEDFLEKVEVTVDLSNQDIDKYGFKYYEEANVFDIELPSEDVRGVSKVIERVVEMESPIHYELLCKRIAPLTGREKATKVVKEFVDLALPYCKESVERRYDFIWDKKNSVPAVRIPETAYYVRDISYIAPEEIAEAMMTIVLSSYGITKEGLYSETRRVFGFNRAGQKIMRAFDGVYEKLNVDGKIKILDGRITLS